MDTSREKSIIFLVRREAAQKWKKSNSSFFSDQILENFTVSKIDNSYKLSINFKGKIYEKLIPMEEFKFYSTKKSDSFKLNPKELNQTTALKFIIDLEKFYNLDVIPIAENRKTKLKIDFNSFLVGVLFIITLLIHWQFNELIHSLILLLSATLSLRILVNSKRRIILTFLFLTIITATYQEQEVTSLLNIITFFIIFCMTIINYFFSSNYIVYLIPVAVVSSIGVIFFSQNPPNTMVMLYILYFSLLYLSCSLLLGSSSSAFSFYSLVILSLSLVIVKVICNELSNFNFSNLLMSIFYISLLFMSQQKSNPHFLLSGIVLL